MDTPHKEYDIGYFQGKKIFFYEASKKPKLVDPLLIFCSPPLLKKTRDGEGGESGPMVI